MASLARHKALERRRTKSCCTAADPLHPPLCRTARLEACLRPGPSRTAPQAGQAARHDASSSTSQASASRPYRVLIGPRSRMPAQLLVSPSGPGLVWIVSGSRGAIQTSGLVCIASPSRPAVNPWRYRHGTHGGYPMAVSRRAETIQYGIRAERSATAWRALCPAGPLPPRAAPALQLRLPKPPQAPPPHRRHLRPRLLQNR